MFWMLIKKTLGTVLFFFGTYIGLIVLFAEDMRRNPLMTRAGLSILAVGLLAGGVTLWNARQPAAAEPRANNDEAQDRS